ncbi:MAG: class I SAM-dependent DNA methyltransferase [Ignavibacteria bacterium]|nr:class I SAM-dependent DNA methyltransferase [Ignavibacteria bacterium]
MLTDPQLKSKVDALWDRFWSGGIANPITAIEQMSYLIFLKRLEDMDNARASGAKRKNESYRSIFHGNRECRWSYWSQLPGDQMLKHVRDKVFDFLRNLGSETSSFTQHMQDAVFIIPKPSLLQEAVKIIDEMHISEQNIDVQGDLYEYLLMQLTTAGKNGQFRTPRHIIRMMVKLVDPKVGDRICDPAAGTGGFLVNAYEHILESNTSPDVLEYDDEGKPHHLIGDKIADKKLLKFLKSQALTGYDFDATMTRIGAMNLMLHGIDNPNFRYTDTLSKGFSEREQYDVILANPPFKGSIDKSDINERFTLKTTKTELLFIELMNSLLVTGGSCGVIVPDGVLFGTSNAHVDLRKILVDKCKLEGVISMPSGVFKPYAGVSTAVLIFQKGGTTDNVWFYDMEADGFSLDDKRQKAAENDIPDILAQWKNKKARHPERSPEHRPELVEGRAERVEGHSRRMLMAAEGKVEYASQERASTKPALSVVEGLSMTGVVGRAGKCFLVAADEIRSNKYDLSISRYKEIEHTEIKYEKPGVIMQKVMRLEKEIENDIEAIKRMVE